MLDVHPGDILLTRNQRSWFARMIRLAAAFSDEPNIVNHVVIVHHRDAAGTLWGIEGKPGGVGWVDVAKYLASPWTIANTDQPKNSAQRSLIVDMAGQLLGTPYDWNGIVRDGMAAIGADHMWRSKQWGTEAPAHVVCSSFADWVYERAGLQSPTPDRACMPADWAQFIILKGWQVMRWKK